MAVDKSDRATTRKRRPTAIKDSDGFVTNAILIMGEAPEGSRATEANGLVWSKLANDSWQTVDQDPPRTKNLSEFGDIKDVRWGKPRSPLVRVPVRMDPGPETVLPKPDELSAIEAVILDDTFESPADMAREIFKVAVAIVRNRQWHTMYVGGNRFEGLESSDTKIRAWSDKNLHPNAGRLYATITGPGLLLQQEREAIDKLDDLEAGHRGVCPECTHPLAMHVVFLSGRIKPDQSNGVGRCTAPGGMAGPKLQPNLKSGKYCGCDYLTKSKDEE